MRDTYNVPNLGQVSRASTSWVRTLPKVDVALCADLHKFLTNNPDLHDQNIWLDDGNANALRQEQTLTEVYGEPKADGTRALDPTTLCGTRGCVAGWALYVKNLVKFGSSWNGVLLDREHRSYELSLEGKRTLGLTDEEEVVLFYELSNQEALWFLEWMQTERSDAQRQEHANHAFNYWCVEQGYVDDNEDIDPKYIDEYDD